MVRKLEILCVYLTGLFQGLVLVTVPAASLVFTSASGFGFSNSEYGSLFIPQVLVAIVAALSGPASAQRWGIRAVFRIGLLFNLLAMALIASSQCVRHEHQAAYFLVILGTGFVGAGFGATLPTINVYAADFFPGNTASALTVLHTLLGLGTALAPFLVAVLVRKIGWWVLPVAVAGALVILGASALVLPFRIKRPVPTGTLTSAGSKAPWRARVRLFILAVFLYGYCETLFANWAIIFLNKEKGVGLQEAGYALAAFWIMVSIGRLLVSIISVWVAARWVYMVLPVLITLSLAGVSTASSPLTGILLFAAAGLSCSAFFPLTFNFGQKIHAPLAEKISGWLMASYMLGYGVAAYGMGKAVEMTHISLKAWYAGSTIVAAGIVFLSFMLMSEP
ncbi:MAG: MFS transporter [Candidatus Omnitrophica bacterium]|nr:MFS transporter [Candidatus Omnitrophota bacterium]